MASGPWKAPHQQAGHMAASTQPCIILKKTLANRESSTHGTKRKLLPPRVRRLWGTKQTSASVAPISPNDAAA